MSVSKYYTKLVKDQTKYSATWLPTITLSPGDVGRISDYQFQLLTNLKQLGIPFETTSGNTQLDFTSALNDGYSFKVKGVGEAPLADSGLAEAEAGISVKFSRENQVLFNFSKCKSTILKDQFSVEKEMLARYDSGNWQDDLVVVTEVLHSKAGTIIISGGSNAGIDLVANGNLGKDQLNLASVEADFKIKKESGISTRIIASKNLTPLFKAIGIDKRPLKKRRVILHGPEGMKIPIVRNVDYEDYSSF